MTMTRLNGLSRKINFTKNVEIINFTSDYLDNWEYSIEISSDSYKNLEKPVLTIRTPQARKRRVNLADLIGALHKALEVNQRRIKNCRWKRLSMKAFFIIIRGPLGCGKSTIAEALAKQIKAK